MKLCYWKQIFSQEIVNNKIVNGGQFNRGCFTHNSLENLIEWLKVRKNKPEKPSFNTPK